MLQKQAVYMHYQTANSINYILPLFQKLDILCKCERTPPCTQNECEKSNLSHAAKQT